MDCIGCPIANICTISQDMRKHSLYVKIDLTECTIKNSVIKNNEEHAIKVQKVELPREHLATPKVMRDFKDISNAIRQQEKEKDNQVAKVQIKSEEAPSNISIPMECPNPECKGKTTLDDITTCKQCGKEICSNCSIETPGGDIICNECWDKE